MVLDKLKLLAPFVGKWNTEGTIIKTESSPEIKIHGTDTYTWLPGGFFLQHIVDVNIGNDKIETYEIIGHDKSNDWFTMHYFDNKGDSGFMTATVIDSQWTFRGENLRFKGGFGENENTFSGIWEQSVDGKTWTHFMDIKLRRD